MKRLARLLVPLACVVAVAAAMRTRRAQEARLSAAQEIGVLHEMRAADAADAARLDHDLRTPIGTLAAALELLKGAPDDAALRSEALDVMSRQVDRLVALTEKLRTLGHDLRTRDRT